jgi:predicted PurR-regulated permease PerM
VETTVKIPFYGKLALISICVFAMVFVLHIGQFIIIPIVYATITAILLNPFVNFLNKKGLNKLISISVAVFFAIIVVFGVLYIVSSQVTMFSDTYPQLKAKFNTTSADLIQWCSDKFNIRQSKINTWIKETESDQINNFAIGEKLTEVGGMMVTLMLLPAYLFMILFYKPLLLEFVRKLFSTEHHVVVAEVLTNSKKIIQNYLVGLFFELIIMAVLYAVGLLFLGVDYAIILGITGAIVNIVPYIGKVVAIILPMLIAFITKDSLTYPVLVFCVYMFIQFIDNHYIIPKIVASRVQLNALISVIVVLIGGAIWGVSGMFLSIPLTAIVKVIFDHIEALKPWGFLLGNVVPTASKFSFIKLKK